MDGFVVPMHKYVSKREGIILYMRENEITRINKKTSPRGYGPAKLLLM